MGLASTAIDQAFAQLLVKLAELEPLRRVGHFTAGIGPHAPYTVHPELLTRLARLSAERRLPMAFHLAESREEIELLQTGGGPFRELLVDRGVWDPAAIRRGTQPIDYLEPLCGAARVLVVHGNYLRRAELAFLAAQSATMALVFCPRTHAYFGHAAYPLAEALSLGVRVALGTDSRASNPDLGLLGELHFLAGHYPAVSPVQLLRMATMSGAEALGQAHLMGTITAGKLANLCSVSLPEHEVADPYRTVLDASSRVVQVWHRGRYLNSTGSQP
jgi:cytosine/adenosine deaminase-related metal-dependent hydrolase